MPTVSTQQATPWRSSGTKNDRLRELADYRDQLLKDSEWRYHELLQQLNLSQESHLALIRSLPAAITEDATAGYYPRPTPGLVAIQKAVTSLYPDTPFWRRPYAGEPAPSGQRTSSPQRHPRLE